MTDQREYFRRTDEGGNIEIEPYRYTLCGLPNVFLLNGFDAEFDECGDRFVAVKDVAGLHHAIALHLASNRKALSPQEVKFLRRTMDLTQSELARKLGQSDQSVARWEKGKTEIPGPADRLLRLMLLDAIDAHFEGRHLLEFLDEIGDLDTAPNEALEFRRDNQEWATAVNG